MKLLGESFNFKPFNGLPPGVLPIGHSKAPFKVTDSQKVSDKKTLLSQYSLNQFPLSPSFAKTIHKLQGLTVDELIGQEWSKSDEGCATVWQPMMLYILMSRVRTLLGLYLRKAITWEDVEAFNTYLPPFQQEQQRLRDLETAGATTYPYPNLFDPAPFDESTIPILTAQLIEQRRMRMELINNSTPSTAPTTLPRSTSRSATARKTTSRSTPTTSTIHHGQTTRTTTSTNMSPSLTPHTSHPSSRPVTSDRRGWVGPRGSDFLVPLIHAIWESSEYSQSTIPEVRIALETAETQQLIEEARFILVAHADQSTLLMPTVSAEGKIIAAHERQQLFMSPNGYIEDHMQEKIMKHIETRVSGTFIMQLEELAHRLLNI